MTKKALLLLFLLALISAGVSQSTPSPITLSGKMDCSKLENPGVVKIKNVSNKMILAYAVAVTSLCFPRHELYRHDYFFKPAGFAAGVTDDFELSPPGSEVNEIKPAPRVFEARVLFVQMADGTTWGDEAAGKELLAQRLEVERFLQRLKEASGDKKAFGEILQEKQTPQTSVFAVSKRLSMMNAQDGMQAALDNVNQRLQIAKDRHISMH